MNLISMQDALNTIPAIEISSPEMLTQDVVVSVLMMTRNQENFLEHAINSVLDQEANFEVEILIGEDFSADNTMDVVLKMQSLYPNSIRVIQAEENVGITKNFLRLLCRAKGEFVAFLEGDDYWTEKTKLQQ